MKHAIITGASGNLGKAAIKKFLANGYHVTGTVVPGHPVVSENDHKNYTSVAVDLFDEAAAQQFINDAALAQNSIDVAILTVGGFAMGKMETTKTSELYRQYKLNFETAYNCARPVFIQMLKQGRGRIFMFGSRPGLDMRHSKGMIAYGISKSLIFRLAELMNDEAKGTDVVTHVIVPSTIDTPQNHKAMPDADYSKWVKPEEIADIIFNYTLPELGILREPVIKAYNKA